MSFNNPILAGEQLVRTGMKSENFMEGDSGWRVDRNGNAEFNDAYIRGTTSGATGSFDELSANNEFHYRGTELRDFLDTHPRGIIAHGWVSYGEGMSTSTEVPIMELQFEAEAGRTYLWKVEPLRGKAAVDNENVGLRFRYTTDGTEPNLNSSAYTVAENTNPLANRYQSVSDFVPFRSNVTGTVRVLLTLHSVWGDTVTLYFDNPAVVIWDVGKTVPNTGINRYTTSGSNKQKYTFDEAFVISESFRGDGSQFNTNAEMYQGKTPYYPANGNMSSFARIPQWICDELNGVPTDDITNLELWIYADHWHYNAGGTLVCGRYDQNGNEIPDIFRYDMARDQGIWFQLENTTGFVDAFSNGLIKGVMFGPSPNADDPTFYGYHRGVTQSNQLWIRGTYYK